MLVALLVLAVVIVLASIAFSVWSIVRWIKNLRKKSTKAPTATPIQHDRVHMTSPPVMPLTAPLTAAVLAAPTSTTTTTTPPLGPVAINPVPLTTVSTPVPTLALNSLPPTTAPVTTLSPDAATVPATVPATAAPTTVAAATLTTAAPTAWKALKPGAGTGVCLATGGTLAACDSSPSQGWTLNPATGLLSNQATGNCLTVSAVTNSVPLSDTTCSTSNPNQKWAAPAAGQLLLAGNQSLSLDMPGGLAAAGAQASTWFVNNSPTQLWTFT